MRRLLSLKRAQLSVYALASVLVALAAVALRRPPARTAQPVRGQGRRETVSSAVSDGARSFAPGYVGSRACQKCHERQYQTYLHTSHSRALSEVVPDREPPDCVFDHGRSGRRYRVTRDDGRLVHHESLLLDNNEELPLSSFPVKHAVGSGHFGKTYLCDIDGFLVESPITWYETRQAWGISPGYDKPEHRAFTRVVSKNCLLCHAGIVHTNPANDLNLHIVEESIGCERCHGPGKAHVEQKTAGIAAEAEGESIINPRQLSRRLSEAVCQQCHLQGNLQVVGRDAQPGDYRPGLPLERFRCEFRVRKPDDGMTIVGHFEQLGQSACYRKSETLTCVTCHDPHVANPLAARASHLKAVCLSCHDDRACKLAFEIRQEKSRNECVLCHMPSSQTEIPHVAFTHHRIGIHPLENEPAAGQVDSLVALSDLSALSDSDRSRALLLAQLSHLVRRGAGVLKTSMGLESARQLELALNALPDEAIDAEVELAAAEFHLICGNQREATTAAERALEFDGINTEAAARALSVLGTVAFEQSRFTDARRSFDRLTLLRRDANDFYQRGLCENNCGDVEAAIRSLELSCRIDPANRGTFEALALIHRARQDVEAEARLKTIIDHLQHRLVPHDE
jgi:predicted CXXCH cytochrome family protein